jgi:sugar/nucleoside kinase (ribokinase family)
MDEGGQNQQQTYNAVAEPLLPAVFDNELPPSQTIPAPDTSPVIAAAPVSANNLPVGEQFDVIGVGDINTDAFIRLFKDQARSYEDNLGKWLAMPFATKLPFDFTEIIEGVGNASNATVACSRLGLKTALVTNVGGDQYGRDMIMALGKNSVDHRFVRINPDKKSNYHHVLWYEEERTILVKHEEYDYAWPHLRSNELPKWLYFSSTSEHAIPYHDQVSDWLDENPAVKLAFGPGTYQLEAGAERLSRIYRRTEVLVLNREEAVKVSGGNYDDIHDLLSRLHALGPKTVVITDGPKGAYASNGQEVLKMPLYPDPAPPYERTGAGDAFAATFVAALIKGNTIEGALQWAPINSMSVVQKVGSQAGLLNEAGIEAWLRQAPDWYKSERL